MENCDWNDLLQRARAGEKEAKNQLCQKLEVRLRPIAKYRLQGWAVQDIEDVIQDTLMSFVEKLNSVQSDPDYFALTMLRNKIGNVYQRWERRQKVTVQMETKRNGSRSEEMKLATAHGKDDFSDQIEVKDLVEYIHDAVLHLPLFCQTLFLGLLDGRSVGDIWKDFTKIEPTLRRNAFDKRIYDCRKKLIELVEGQI